LPLMLWAMGDDINDLANIVAAVVFCPQNAMNVVKSACRYRSYKQFRNGAIQKLRNDNQVQ
jgi:3-deoxy-D-manno-octulosonate 8-phosphate phosphatase KdsC-like HAD superfamily phosphatase